MAGQRGLTDLPRPGDKYHLFVEVHADRRFEVATKIHDPDYTQKQKKTQLNLLIGKKSHGLEKEVESPRQDSHT